MKLRYLLSFALLLAAGCAVPSPTGPTAAAPAAAIGAPTSAVSSAPGPDLTSVLTMAANATATTGQVLQSIEGTNASLKSAADGLNQATAVLKQSANSAGNGNTTTAMIGGAIGLAMILAQKLLHNQTQTIVTTGLQAIGALVAGQSAASSPPAATGASQPSKTA